MKLENFQLFTYSETSRIKRSTLLDLSPNTIELYMDEARYFCENEIALTVTADFLGKPLSPQRVTEPKTFYIRVPYNNRQWKRFYAGKEVKRWRDVKVVGNVTFEATPVLLFPEHNLGIFPKKRLGRISFRWENPEEYITSVVITP